MTSRTKKRCNRTTDRFVIRWSRIFSVEYQYNRIKQAFSKGLFHIYTVVLSIAGGGHTCQPFFIWWWSWNYGCISVLKQPECMLSLSEILNGELNERLLRYRRGYLRTFRPFLRAVIALFGFQTLITLLRIIILK